MPALVGCSIASFFGPFGLDIAASAQVRETLAVETAVESQAIDAPGVETQSTEVQNSSAQLANAVNGSPANTPSTDTEVAAAASQPSPSAVPVPALLTLAQRRVQVLDLALIPLDMSPSGDALATGLAVTSETLSDTGTTNPSLWWQKYKASEIGPLNGRSMVNGWVAHYRPGDQQHHVDVAVNGQIWNLLNYLEQYAFITQFGEAAKAYGYHLRVFNGSSLVGGYVCDFNQTLDFGEDGTIPNEQLSGIACTVGALDYLGQSAISGRTANPLSF